MNRYQYTTKFSEGTTLSHDDFTEVGRYCYNAQLDDGVVYAQIWLKEGAWDGYEVSAHIGREKHRGAMGAVQQKKAEALLRELRPFVADMMQTTGWRTTKKVWEKAIWVRKEQV